MVVAAVPRAAQALIAVASTSRQGLCRKEGVFGAQCSSVNGVGGARRACSVRGSANSDSKDDEASASNAFTKMLQNCATCAAVAVALLMPLSTGVAAVAFERAQLSQN